MTATFDNLMIHIGYHKTGTTWLQRRLFIPDHGYAPLMTHAEIAETVLDPHPLEYSPDMARARIARLLTHVPPGRCPVLSSETLSGNPFHGGRDGPATARRLREAPPGARILITLRDPEEMIASTYMQYLRRGGTLSPAAYFDQRPPPGYPSFDARHFEVDRLVALYQRLFGRRNVLVMHHRDLIADPMAYATRIARFAGAAPPAALDTTRETRSDPAAAIPLLRRVNRLRAGPMSTRTVVDTGRVGRMLFRLAARAGQFMPDPEGLSRAVAARFGTRFEASQQRLAALIEEPVTPAPAPPQEEPTQNAHA